jgi:hypothetical protein
MITLKRVTENTEAQEAFIDSRNSDAELIENAVNGNADNIASNEARIDTAEEDITQLELDLADAEIDIANNESAIADLQNNLQSYDTVSYATPNYIGGRLLETRNDVYLMGYDLLTKAYKLAYKDYSLKVYLDLGSGYVIGVMSFNSVTGEIEIVVDSTTYSYAMGDDTALTTQTYLRAYHGALKGTDDYIDLRFDLPSMTALFDGANPRNILRESGGINYLANLKDIVNDNDTTQATETSQPSVDEDGVITFDGIDDELTFTPRGYSPTDKWAFFFIIKINLTTNGQIFFAGNSNDGASAFTHSNALNLVQLRNSLLTYYDFDISSTDLLDSNFHMLTFTADGNGNLSVYVDKILIETKSAITSMNNINSIGSGYTGAQYLSKDSFKQVGIIEKYLTQSEVNQIYDTLIGV